MDAVSLEIAGGIASMEQKPKRPVSDEGNKEREMEI